MKKKRRLAGVRTILAIAGVCLLTINEANAAGQSAVITLTFPVGARPTAMGEAFTGLADDANAIFYNPAGLGQSPLTLSWKTHKADSAFTAVAARSSTEFGARNYVWAGNANGISRFNGRIWEKGDVYLPGADESLRSIARQYFLTDDGAIIDEAVWEIRRENKLGMKRYEQLVTILESQAEAFANDSVPFDPRSYAKKLILLPPNETAVNHIAAQVLPQTIDAAHRVALAEQIINALSQEDRNIDDVIELAIPYSIAVRDTVTAMALDASERLWVGTVNGLWRYHGNKWQRFTAEDGLPSNRVTSVSVSQNGDVAVGTETGLAIMNGSEWIVLNDENGLPDSYVTSVAHAGNNQLYIGTPRGLARRAGENIAVFDTSSGLLSLGVTALFADSKGRLWIGGENGISIYSGGTRSWTRYRFPGSIIYSFAEQSNGTIWIGTNKGVITHKNAKSEGAAPEWKTYHSKNALRNDNVRAVAACGKDMWLATDGAVQQYANAEMQILLFYEQLMPSFRMNDLWHGFPAIVIPTEEWGTLGFSLNFVNMGSIEQYGLLEEYLGESRAWEGVFGISYGLPIKEDLSLGLNAKYVLSILDQEAGGVGQTFAVDVGVLKRNFLVDKFDVGFMLQNMGPHIYYRTPEEADPIPFSLRLGLAYRPIHTPFHELNFVFDAYREVVRTYEDKRPDPFWVALWTGMLNNNETTLKEEMQEINLSMGMEYTYADFMSLRSGLLLDYVGERYEMSLGLGVKYGTMNFDFSYIYSPPNFLKDGTEGARDGQWRLSFLFGL